MKLLGLLPLAALLPACTDGAHNYPSLTMRPFEDPAVAASVPEPPARPLRPATPEARLAELLADAAASDSAFSAREAEAARLARAAAGLPFESDARAAAMVAIADLDSKRATTASTLAALDSLAAEAATALSPDPGVVTAQGKVAALLARQDASIARLWETMGT